MGLNFDKHKEHLEKDIRAALQKKFGSGFEIEGIYDIVLSSYCPTFLFKINLENIAVWLYEKPLQALSICGKIRVTEIRKGNQLWNFLN